MDKYVVKDGKKLRRGYTTGTCAAAAAKAAAVMLLSGENVGAVDVTTPAGITLELEIVDVTKKDGCIACAVVKDAGDDPDVTDGLKIFAAVSSAAAGIEIDGGEGIGRVGKAGLQLAVGQAAINPVPRLMIENELAAVLASYPDAGGLRVIISAPGGAAIAQKTFNPRLGITGGISILGTTGIVEPMSEKAIVDTIYLEMQIRKKRGDRVLLLTPGNYGAEFAKTCWGLNLGGGVKCSNFIGEALDYGVYLGFGRILLVGHAGKLLKLAAGIMNTHSRVADGRLEILAAHAGLAGAAPEQIKALLDCATTEAAFTLLDGWELTGAVVRTVREKIAKNLFYRVGEGVKTAFVLFRDGNRVLCVSCRDDLNSMLLDLNRDGDAG